MSRRFVARGIVEGRASGPALVSREAVSFLGDVDIRSGRIVGQLPSVQGRSLGGMILIMPFTRGSAGAWRFIYQLFKHGHAPAAIVSGTLPDPSVVQGAILAGVPIACEPADPDVLRIRDGARVEIVVDGENATIVANE